MGLPGLRGPPGTKVSQKFPSSYTVMCMFWICLRLICCCILHLSFRVYLVTKEKRYIQDYIFPMSDLKDSEQTNVITQT